MSDSARLESVAQHITWLSLAWWLNSGQTEKDRVKIKSVGSNSGLRVRSFLWGQYHVGSSPCLSWICFWVLIGPGWSDFNSASILLEWLAWFICDPVRPAGQPRILTQTFRSIIWATQTQKLNCSALWTDYLQYKSPNLYNRVDPMLASSLTIGGSGQRLRRHQ